MQSAPEERDAESRPPGFGRYPWWAPLIALAVALLALSPPLILLDARELPFPATLAQALFLAVLFAVGLLLVRHRGGRPNASALGLRATPARAAVGWVAVAWFSYAVLAGMYVAAAGPPDSNVPLGVDEDLAALAAVDVVIAVLVLAPVGEELFFRGFLYASLRGRLPVLLAAPASGAIFAAIHPVYGGAHWNLVPILAIAGVAMCLLYERTGSLWPAIAFHGLMNMGILGLVTGSPVPPLAVVGAATLLFLVAPWRFRGRGSVGREARRGAGTSWSGGRTTTA